MKEGFYKIRSGFNIQCSQLSEQGKQCRNIAIVETDYHGSADIYNYPAWVRVFLCKKHKENFERL